MAEDLLVDREALRDQVRAKYREVALDPGADFHFHTGRGLASRLGYDGSAVGALPDRAVESFAGVGNPFSLRPLSPGEHMVDVGSGAGFDSVIAAGADQVLVMKPQATAASGRTAIPAGMVIAARARASRAVRPASAGRGEGASNRWMRATAAAPPAVRPVLGLTAPAIVTRAAARSERSCRRAAASSAAISASTASSPAARLSRGTTGNARASAALTTMIR